MIQIFIVTESGCDITERDIQKYDNIFLVPMQVSFENVSKADSSFPVSDIFTYYQRTRQLPKTSGANIYDYKSVFDDILKKHPDCHILHLGYSAVTTVSFQNAVLASDNNDKITHIDTKQVSGGGRTIVIAMAEYIRNNPYISLTEAIEKANKYIKTARFVFFPGKLEYLKAGGRVSNAAYMLASFLELKPLIEMIDGKLTATKKYRGKDHIIYKKLINDYLSKHKFDKSSFFMVHSEGLDKKLQKELEKEAKKYGYANIEWVDTGCVISTHCGPGAFGLGGFEIE